MAQSGYRHVPRPDYTFPVWAWIFWHAYSPFITDFLRQAQLPRLSAQDPSPDQQLIRLVAGAKDDQIARQNGPQSSCTRSLLFLAAGDVTQAHRIVQEISTADAAYIHGVIHRIDDDFNNARYWFRNAGTHPAGAEMYRRAAASSPTIAKHPTWDPALVTRMVENRALLGALRKCALF